MTSSWPACCAQALLHSFGELASVAWTSLIAHSLDCALFGPGGCCAPPRPRVALGVGYGVPLILVTIPLLSRQVVHPRSSLVHGRMEWNGTRCGVMDWTGLEWNRIESNRIESNRIESNT